MADRQPFPVGDEFHGQLVQTNTSLQVANATPRWAHFFSLTVSTSVVSLGQIALSFNRAIITVESNSIRFTIDGTLPTASLGHLAVNNDSIDLESLDELREFRAIREGAADATLMVTLGNI